LNSKRSILSYNFSIYHRQISNSIIWLPENGIWRASNIHKSLSNGIEFETKTAYTDGKSTFQWKNSYKYNMTILDDKAKGFDSTLALYNPEHLFYSSVRFLKKNFYAEISFKYNSRLYTTFDNTEFLDPVLLGNFYTGITSKYKKMHFHLDLAIENIFGVEYESIKNYAMPGRVLTLKAKIIFNNTK
jgi:outer membrane cobalamin receptor